MAEQGMPINFLELSETYKANTPPHIRVRRHKLVENMDGEYFLAARGVTDEISRFMESRGRPIGRSMLHQDSLMYRIVRKHLKGETQDIGRFQPVLECLINDGIQSWADVDRLAAEKGTPQVDIDELFPPPAAQPELRIGQEPEEEEEEGEALPRLIAFAEEDVARVRERILQAKEDITALIEALFVELRSAYGENYTLRENERLLTARLRRIESGGTIEEVTGIPALLEQVELSRRQIEREKMLRDLPRYSEFYKRPVEPSDRFVREFERLAVTEHRVIARQMRTCFNLNPFHPSLNTQTVRQPNIPNTNQGDSISRASEGLRFTWRAAESRIEILWIMPREDLP